MPVINNSSNHDKKRSRTQIIWPNSDAGSRRLPAFILIYDGVVKTSEGVPRTTSELLCRLHSFKAYATRIQVPGARADERKNTRRRKELLHRQPTLVNGSHWRGVWCVGTIHKSCRRQARARVNVWDKRLLSCLIPSRVASVYLHLLGPLFSFLHSTVWLRVQKAAFFINMGLNLLVT